MLTLLLIRLSISPFLNICVNAATRRSAFARESEFVEAVLTLLAFARFIVLVRALKQRSLRELLLTFPILLSLKADSGEFTAGIDDLRDNVVVFI